LQVAEQCGLKIPPTCVTNDPQTARAFIESQEGHVVYKILRGGESHYVGTTLLENADLGNFNLVYHCPVIFQHFVEPGFDIRVTVVGDSVFPAKLTSRKPAGRYDIRRDITCKIEEYELPPKVEGGIRWLTARLGLRFAAVDMRANRLGEHYFLEVNPTGQYLFVETATNQPITAALARLLANPCPRRKGKTVFGA
jgi:glutathione synthase/RimK-type ligase-like ATP-grasp enzyme